jgi:Kef-type K+ transport system membrane component KefB
VAAVQFFLCGLAAFIVALALGFSSIAAMYFGFAVSASSTLVVTQHLRSQGQMFQPFGRLVTGVLLLQDFAIVLVLIVLAALPRGGGDILMGLGGFSILAVLAGMAHFVVIPKLTQKFQSDDETLLLLGLATLFCFVGAASLLQLPIVAGAFLAGFSLAAFPVNGLLRGLIGSLSGFFQALFFTALGMLVTIASWEVLGQALLISLVVLFLTPLIVSAVIEFTGQSTRTAIESGLLLAQVSELGIILGLLGVYAGQVSADQFSVLALVAGITMTLTPLLATDQVTWRLMHWHPSRRSRNSMAKFENHILMLGFGSSGMWVVKPLQDAGHRILIVDDDSAVIEELALLGVPCLRGDASDEQLLRFAGVHRARLIITAVPRIGDVLKVLEMVQGVPVVARVFEEMDAERIRRAGGMAILNSEAAVRTFLEWFGNFNSSKQSGPPSTDS